MAQERANAGARSVIIPPSANARFRDRFGRPGKGNDKGKVEALVKTARRKFMVPIPKVPELDILNERMMAR